MIPLQDLLRGAVGAAPTLVASAVITLAMILAIRVLEESLRSWASGPRRLLKRLASTLRRRHGAPRRRRSIRPLAAALIALVLNAFTIGLEVWTLRRGDSRLAVLVASLVHNVPEFGTHVVTVVAIALGRERAAHDDAQDDDEPHRGPHNAERWVSRLMLGSAWLANAFALHAVDHPHRGGITAFGVALTSVACDATAARAYSRAARGSREAGAGGWIGLVRRQALHMKIDFVTGAGRVPGSAAAARGVTWLDPAAALTMAALMVWGAVHHRHEADPRPPDREPPLRDRPMPTRPNHAPK